MSIVEDKKVYLGVRRTSCRSKRSEKVRAPSGYTRCRDRRFGRQGASSWDVLAAEVNALRRCAHHQGIRDAGIDVMDDKVCHCGELILI